MTRALTVLSLLFLLSVTVWSQPRLYLAPMEGGFDSFLAAALIETEVPVLITTDEATADFIVTGQAVKGQNRWYDTVFGAERDRNQGSIKLLKVSDRTVVWAGAAGDRSIWWGALKSGGQKKVASRLARQLKKDYFSGKLSLARDTTLPTTVPANTAVSDTDLSDGRVGKAPGNYSKVEIRSLPEGADITVNGNFMGSTPIVLKSGEHTIVITKAGYKKWERFVRLEAGSSITLNATLVKE